jgi:hypothetical protein
MWRHRGLLVAVWHPFVSGRLARCEQVDQMIELMQRQGDVWFATLEDIALHVKACMHDKTFTPRIETEPDYAA